MTQINDLELAVRTIDELLPNLPTKSLQKWLGIFNTAAIKIEAELNSTMMHRCTACGFEEYGYRTELPIAWRQNGDTVICFNHEEKQIDAWLAENKKAEADEPVDTDKALDDLMALI